MIELFRHLQAYGYYYINLFLVPLLYNKITYEYRWNELPIVSTKFAFLYFITFLLLVFTTAMACYIQRWGTEQVDDEQFKWRSVWYRLCFYLLPVAVGLMVLITFKFLWYEGEDLYLILMHHAKSRFFIYVIFFVVFSMWLDRNPKHNWFSAKYYKRFQYEGHDEKNQQNLLMIGHNETNAKLETVGMALEKFTDIFENSTRSLVEHNMQVHDDGRFKSLLKEALNEFIEDQPEHMHTKQVLDGHYVKVLVKEAIQELENLDNVLLENLYASLYVKSTTKLIPFFNGLKEVKFYHIFAIESHTKSATVILTDGTRIVVDNILDILTELGLLNWMAKISKVYYINIIHVCIESPVDGKLVRVQALTLKALHENLEKIQILKICGLGNKIKDRNIKAFLDSRSEHSNESLDTFVRLN